MDPNVAKWTQMGHGLGPGNTNGWVPGYTPALATWLYPAHVPAKHASPAMNMQRQALTATRACTYGRFETRVGEPRGTNTQPEHGSTAETPKECLNVCQN